MQGNLKGFTDESGKYITCAWPGLYPVIYFTVNGLIVCPHCANREVDSSQRVIAGDIYWEGPDLTCEDCEAPMASAYGDPKAE